LAIGQEKLSTETFHLMKAAAYRHRVGMLRNQPLLANCSADAFHTGLVFEVALTGSSDDALQPPEWIQLTPRGSVKTRDGRFFIFDPERLASAFRKDDLKLPIDFEHESSFVPTLGPRPARSWIVEMEARAAGLFGRVEWLPDAIAALRAKSYRYISPTLWLDPDGKTPRLVKAAALCASPALGMPALASSQKLPTNGDQRMKTLLAKLGLTENATEAEALAKVEALSSAADPALFVPVAQLTAANAQLATLRAEVDAEKVRLQAEKCQALIDKGVSDGKIAPAAKDHYLSFAKADFVSCSAALEAMPALVASGTDKTVDAASKASGDPASLSAEEAVVAKNLGLTAEQFAAAKVA
jgi:phage I-like protein